jgi:tellurite resistance protein TerC
MSVKKAVQWVLFWMVLAFVFNVGVYLSLGEQKALEFFGGYIIELSLSLDNLFLFLLIFSSFTIEPKFQRRILNYGIAGAIVLRLLFVASGVAIVQRFHWVLYIFGVILIISGIKMLIQKEENQNIKDSKILKWFGKIIPVSEKMEGEKFFVRHNNILYATPLLAILVLIEISDIIFAIDSIPAIFSITTDTFIVFSSNIFAILGLRNMYFILERVHRAFRFVKFGVGIILIFTGIKLAVLFFNVEISTVISLLIIFTILVISIVTSVLIKETDSETGTIK